MQRKTDDLELYRRRVGLKPNLGRSKELDMNKCVDNPVLHRIQGADIKMVEHLTYLG